MFWLMQCPYLIISDASASPPGRRVVKKMSPVQNGKMVRRGSSSSISPVVLVTPLESAHGKKWKNQYWILYAKMANWEDYEPVTSWTVLMTCAVSGGYGLDCAMSGLSRAFVVHIQQIVNMEGSISEYALAQEDLNCHCFHTSSEVSLCNNVLVLFLHFLFCQHENGSCWYRNEKENKEKKLQAQK